MNAFLFAFGCIILAVILLQAAGCSRTLELTKNWTQEKSARNREKTAKAAKILTAASIALAVVGVVGAVLIAVLSFCMI